MTHDMNTTLRSELAALQYKRDRLLAELQDMKSQLRSRDQRTAELQVETEQLKEQAARQNAIIASLRQRIQELEESERSLNSLHGRSEMALNTLQRDHRYQEERSRDLERKVARLELDCSAEQQGKEVARKAMSDFVRRLGSALGAKDVSPESMAQDALVHKASELVQETSLLRSRSANMVDTLSKVEVELRSCRDALERALTERETFQRQAASHMMEIDRLRQEKETLEIQQRAAERELQELRDKLASVNRSLGTATGTLTAQEATISTLRDDLKQREEKGNRLQNELRHLIESLAILLSTPVRFVESHESCVKERIREIICENQDKSAQVENLKDKIASLNSQLNRNLESADMMTLKLRNLEEDKAVLESRLGKAEVELTACDVTKESLRRDKSIVSTVKRLVCDVCKIFKSSFVVIVLCGMLTLLHVQICCVCYGTIPRLRRERSCCDIPVRESAVVYNLQRRVRNLRDQLQRRDLHLDLLRRKLTLHEDSTRMRSLLEAEKDEANQRAKKFSKQVDRLQLQLAEVRSLNRDLKEQLTLAGDYKLTALERGKKIDELQKRLLDSEMLRTRCTRKVTLLKDQVRTTSESADQERSMCENSMHILRDDLNNTKASLADCIRRENQLVSLRTSVCSLLSLDVSVPDYEIISKLTKMANAHREFTLVSRRYDDPLQLPHVATARSPRASPVHKTCTPRFGAPPHSPHNDSGFLDPILDDCDSDINTVYNKRPMRGAL
ncbi:coiled-coil domain-containing protein 170 [Nilaparvata lugens]|uniref:coiled-coil domain-containing protein 170 n=1 Tax=Nilaparvata lugens TaxID=108931 RepID=UPI00193CF575|nr:coiled-coil domain-containing protein 170 [Nilaparvata lugens]